MVWENLMMKSNERQTAEGFLYTDMYQLTMAQLYYREGIHEQEALFDYFFRSYPDYGQHQAGYCIFAGLAWLLDWLEDLQIHPEEIAFLAGQKGSTGKPLFEPDFLAWLERAQPFSELTIRAVPEGRVVHPNVPIVVVEGPLLWAQILETSLLNHLNYQTLIATKASRMRDCGQERMLLEFGLRRGPDRGASAGGRAALIGGADFSSNVGLSKIMGLEPKGTHAHSMVQVFISSGGTELDAFKAYAEVYPDDCLLLVDTIDTLESGIPNAIKVFKELRQNGHKPVGIRLDSGDLAFLSLQARKMLDEAGFPDTIIVLSNQLDELVIWQIATQIQAEASSYHLDPDHVLDKLVYGVGTRLIASEGQPALDGVYKLVSIKQEGVWTPAIKISENPDKIINPGYKHVWRAYDNRGKATVDILSMEDENPGEMEKINLHHPTEHAVSRTLMRDEIERIEPLLETVWQDGKALIETPSLEEMRLNRLNDVSCLDPGVRRIINPHVYHISLTRKLWELKQGLVSSLS